MIKKSINYFLLGLIFIIPIAWWTRLNANYYSTKLTLFFLAGACAWLLIPDKIALPKFSKPMLYSLILIIAFQIIKHTYVLSLYDFLFLFKFLSFSALLLWFYTLNLNLEIIYKKTTYVIFAVLAIILSFSIYEFWNFRILNFTTDVSTYLSTFGNVNMFAEFFVLSIPFVFHWTRFKDKIPQWLKLTMLSFWFFFILYCRSRSAWIGLLLWLIIQFRYKIEKKELSFIGISFLVYLASIYLPADANIGSTVKANSFNERLGLYQSSIELILDNPWGIRPGRFMGEIEPYQMSSSAKPSEFTFFDQPHSEILKWGVQFGWVFLTAAMVFIFSVIFYLGKWFINEKHAYFVESFVVLVPQVLFQFPFENPASLLYLSVVFGLFFREFSSPKSIDVHIAFKPLLYFLFIACAYNSFAFVNSVYQESTMPRNENIVAACEMYPINVKTCLAKLTYFYENKKYENFLTDFKIELFKEPFFADYLRLLPTYYSVKNDHKKTCESLFVYSTIFPNPTAFLKVHYDNCKDVPNLFYFENPQQFKTKYLTWLDNLN